MKHRIVAGAICALLVCAVLRAAAARPAAALQEAPAATAAAETPFPSPQPTVAAPDGTEAPLPTPLPLIPQTDWRYGVIESYEAPEMATRLGASWTRVRFQWAEVQPGGPEDWEPAVSDEQIEVELEAGREVIGLLIGVPDWARDRDDLPSGLYLPDDDPDNTWAVFVREAVGRYAGQIDHWVIWNEPDIDDPDAPGHTWDGTVEDFAQLQRVAYRVARETNQDAVIHLAAVTHFWDPAYFGTLLDALGDDPDADANNTYFDVATAHLYFQPGSVYDILSIFRQTMDDQGLDQPIWLVETNAPPIDDPYWRVSNWTLSVTLYEQAAFVPQALAAALAAGAERIAFFKLMDTAADRAANPEPFGLVRFDTSRRPAFDAYRAAIPRLAGATRATRERWDAVGQIRVDQDEQTTTVLFSRLPTEQTATVRATAPTADLFDMWGKRRTVEPQDGAFIIDLPAANCTQSIGDYCMIGGATFYLVQAIDAETLSQLPVVDALATPTPGAPTPAPDPTAVPSPTGTPTATAAAVETEAARATPERADMEPAAADATPSPGPTPSGTEVTQPAAPGTPGGVFDYVGLLFLGLAAMIAVGAVVRWRRGN
jgi:hypothetical protein